MRPRSLPLLFCLLLCILCGCATFADAEQRTVRVGFFPFRGFQETLADGRHAGYGYQYLQRIARITGWRYEYVDASWSECLAMLERGEIDLLGSVERTPEREARFAFPKLESGISYAILYTKANDTDLPYEDFEAFDGIRVGMLKGSIHNDALKSYADAHGFGIKPTIYETQDELSDALDNGTIDAILTSSLRKPVNRRIIARFGPLPFYFATRKDDAELLKELNDAQEAIKTDDPYFDMRLYDRFYQESPELNIVFSSKERDAIARMREIRVAYIDGWEPLASFASDTPSGIAADVFKAISHYTGIRCVFVRAENHRDALSKVMRHEVDAVCFMEYDERIASRYDLNMTRPYMRIPITMLARADWNNEQAPSSIGLPRNFEERLAYIQKRQHPNIRIVWTMSPREAYDELLGGTIDLAYSNIYSANYLLSRPEYASLTSVNLVDYATEFSIGLSKALDPTLVSAIDKVIQKMNPSELTSIVVANTAKMPEPSLSRFVQAYPLRVMGIFAFLLILITLVFTFVLMLKNRTNQRIRDILHHDSLTGLWNLTKLIEEGDRKLREEPYRYALLYIDIDDFKYINDVRGYAGGDAILKRLAEELRNFIGHDEIVAKIAADHFILLLRHNGQVSFENRLKKLDGVLSSFNDENAACHTIFSCGICIINASDTIVEALDHAHYAKDSRQRAHHNTYFYFSDDIMARVREEKNLEESMGGSLANGDFIPYFQPKVDMTTGELVGAEALVRWRHPERGLIPPGVFIPLFERNAFITKIDFHIYEETCRFLRALLDGGKRVIPISCNFSRIHFLDLTFPDRLLDVARRHGVPTSLIDIELTETIAMGNTNMTIQQVTRLKELEFKISIDDFGTGYSSLGLLCKLDMDMLKLDKMFLDQAQTSPCNRELIEGLLQMAARLGITVLCEGVETQEQADFLKAIGCTLAQGYLYDRPLPREDFERKWIDR